MAIPVKKQMDVLGARTMEELLKNRGCMGIPLAIK